MANLIVMKGAKFTVKRLMQWLEEDGKVFVQTKRDEFRLLSTLYSDTDLPLFHTASGGTLEQLELSGQWKVHVAQVHRFLGAHQLDMGVMINDSFELTRRILRSKTPYDLTGGTEYHIKDEKWFKLQDGTKEKRVVFEYRGPLNISFWLYDMPGCEDSYEDRLHKLKWVTTRTTRVHLPETHLIGAWGETHDNCYKDIMALFGKAVGSGHEGLMVKRFNHKWVPTRTVDWMKLKPSDEKDGRIVGFNPGTVGTEFEGMVGSVQIDFEDGSQCNTSGFTMELRQDFTDYPEKYLGKVAEIHYMQRDAQGGYRHPSLYRIHPDKETL
ncbi:DNA ligase [Aeromonas phage Atoyac13]|nr:DNA ligase [Aeromonas phage Atoyac13]